MKTELIVLICSGISLFVFILIFILKSFIKLRKEELSYFPNSQHLKIVREYNENATIHFSFPKHSRTSYPSLVQKQKHKDYNEERLAYDIKQMYVTTNCL